MTVTLSITYSISIVLLLVLLKYEFCRNLMMFQQNSYRTERYRRWFSQSGESTSYPNLMAIILFLLGLTNFAIRNFTVACIGIFAAIMIIKLARRKYKKPLVMTKRAARLLTTMFFVTIIVTGISIPVLKLIAGITISTCLFMVVEILLLSFILVRLVVYIADFLTRPIEKHINKRFYDDASKRLSDMPDLIIVGITGSYGKTSTKHYLQRILSEQYETLMTPGSYNTTLGVVRTIREYLKPYHQVFIVEMGAKQKGDIKEITDLVHPGIGIITAVGPQHLETFGNIENVRDTKFELVDSLPADGLAVVNNDYPIIADRPINNCRVARYGLGDVAGAQFVATNMRYGATGTTFDLIDSDGRVMTYETVLLGDYNIANLAAAIAVAIELGMSYEKIRYAVSRIEPVEHRLSIRRHANGLTIIDDAFNSNPAGSRMAVEVLSRMTGGRRVIITPGMIELGESQQRLNEEFGRHIARSGIDIAMVVGRYNRDAIVAGLREGGMDDNNILTFETFLDANAHLVANVRPGDVALLENDLPDTFK